MLAVIATGEAQRAEGRAKGSEEVGKGRVSSRFN